MLKTKLRFTPEPEKIDPVIAAISAANSDAAKRADAGNKALIEAIKTVIVTQPQVPQSRAAVVQPTTPPSRPRKWTFTVERDENNLMTRIIAEAG